MLIKIIFFNFLLMLLQSMWQLIDPKFYKIRISSIWTLMRALGNKSIFLAFNKVVKQYIFHQIKSISFYWNNFVLLNICHLDDCRVSNFAAGGIPDRWDQSHESCAGLVLAARDSKDVLQLLVPDGRLVQSYTGCGVR